MTQPAPPHPAVRLGNRQIGGDAPTLVIAEIGNTHEGSLGQAKALVRAAAECGADAVKLQTHLADAEMVADAPFPPYFRPNESRRDYFRRIAFSHDQYLELLAFARDLNLLVLSSPFSIAAVDLLEAVDIPGYKIPSGEITNLPYIDYIARLRKPILISSGMSSWPELDEAIETIRRHHNDLVVLQCTSAYPCPPDRVGLNVIAEMRARYRCPVGLSDHTPSVYAAMAAVTLGADVIEKHFTLSKLMFGPDPPFSHDPPEFSSLVQGIREIEQALRHPVDKNDLSGVREMKPIFEKSIVAARDLPAGTVLASSDLTTKKPGTGLPPRRLPELLGRKTTRFVAADTLLGEGDIA